MVFVLSLLKSAEREATPVSPSLLLARLISSREEVDSVPERYLLTLGPR